jgi:hypothetical protein
MYHRLGTITPVIHRGGGILAVVTVLTWAGQSSAATPSVEELWQLVQEQQRTIEALRERLDQTEEKLASTEHAARDAGQRADAVADVVEAIENLPPVAATERQQTHVGGYGELHYNNIDSKNEIDFHRFVLYASHDFSDRIHFFSELEVEHALIEDTDDGSGPGEVELEQAWLGFDLTDKHQLRAGLDVLPIGLINYTHEPDTFFGVERNRVETVIIPSTWWEALLSMNGEIAPGWNYNVALHSGLDTPATGSNAFRIRSGRSKVAEARANDPAITGALRYTGMAGVEIGISGQYQNNVTQGQDSLDIDGTLIEGHIALRRGMFGLRALGARWDLDGGPAGFGPAANGRDEQYGYYVEPALFLDAPGVLPGELGVFARYSYVDDRAGADADSEVEEVYAGLNYWPYPGVVFKLDIQNGISGTDDGFNLGMGYSF